MSREEREARIEKKNHKLRARADLERRAGEAELEIRSDRKRESDQISRAHEIDRRVAQENSQQNRALAHASRIESMTRVAVILKFGDPGGWDYPKNGKAVYGR